MNYVFFRKGEEMEEQLISFDVAKLAKEKGFNIPTINVYIGDELISNKLDFSNSGFTGSDFFVEINDFVENWNKPNWVFTKECSECFGCKLDNKKYFEACSASTQAILHKWLREVHEIIVFIAPVIPDCKEFGFDIYSNKFDIETPGGFYKTYEEALEAGLYQGLKLITNNKKE